ncbi:MAG TPA: hypothetical protein VII12_21105, partial [Thermoanaerobaculia bacterium]
GEEREYETSLGDYKEAGGWYLPYSYETNAKGSPFKQKVTYEKVEVNLPLPDSRFVEPAVASKAPPAAPDAANVQPKKPDEKKPPETEPKKPPINPVILSRVDGEGSQPTQLEILRSAQDDERAEER